MFAKLSITKKFMLFEGAIFSALQKDASLQRNQQQSIQGIKFRANCSLKARYCSRQQNECIKFTKPRGLLFIFSLSICYRFVGGDTNCVEKKMLD